MEKHLGSEMAAIPHLEFCEKLPPLKELSGPLGFEAQSTLAVVDRKLKYPHLRQWLKQFKAVYEVSGGEDLKDLRKFPAHAEAMVKKIGPVSPRSFAVFAVGGGTVGDFAGFFASVFKRGVPLVQVPSTFLAAIDSAHGGKTALNLKGAKNQIGSFHQARAVLVAKELLKPLPQAQCHSAMGELIKMALLSGGEFYSQVNRIEKWDFLSLWNLLPLAVRAKYEIVNRDPFESLGERQLLNLGHTLGHALEAQYQLAHGEAVSMGLGFAIRWSHHRGYLSQKCEGEALALLHERLKIPTAQQFLSRKKRMSTSRLRSWLEQDKKLVDGRHVSFVFLEGFGKARRVQVPIESMLTEAERQGWV